MTSSRLQTIALALAFLALGAVALWQHFRIKRLLEDTAALRQQLLAARALQQENERMNEQLRGANQRSLTDFQELLRLRNQAARTRQIEQENAQLKIQRDELAKRVHSPGSDQPTASDRPEDTANFPEQKFQSAKGFFGRNLGMALIRAAEANGGVLPAELSGPLFKMVESLSGAEEYDFRARQFELVYQGSLRNVKDVSQIILAREKEPVRGADGQWKRLYVIADGSSQWVAADSPEGFSAREQQFWPGHFQPR
jgi:hypothetical protein